MPNTDRLINHQDGLKIVTQLEEIASALGHSNKVTGVKGSSEINYRTGNVDISPSDLGLGHIQEDIDELANEKADAATTLAGYGITDSYTKSEVDNIVSEIETNILWKQAVTNYADIATTYPNPEEGWTVNVTSTNQTYRYNGSEWVMINTNIIPEATTSISGLMTSAHVIKLNGIEEGAEVNVQADWNQTNSSHDGFIKNKPDIPSKTSELINDSNFITNENLSTVAMTGEFSDLQDIPTTISGYGISNAYTKDEVDNIVSTIETSVTWKAAVTNYSDIATTYPNPEEGWTVNVTSTNSTYRYNGTEWVLINTNVIPNATTSVNGLMTTTHVEKLDSIETSAQKNVQADWNEDDYVSDSYIKNKPTLGTASTKDAPVSGDATNTQVVLGSDSRLSDARPASDVSAWAKAATKPTYTAAEVGAIASTEKGTASGVAELDANGKVPSSQLPSYVDDVKEGYLNSTDGKFYEESTYETEIPAEADKIYVDKATNITYRWSGSAFVAIGSDLALGETSTTAYRGDRGKAAYDHASDANKISAATASGFYKVGATAEGHVSDLIAVTKTDITNLGIPGEVDTELSSTSTNPVQNKVILEAFPNKGFNNIWETKIWNITPEFSGNYIWSDGNDTYLSIGSNQYVLNKSTSTWTAKTWSGLTNFSGNYIWSDGDNIYFSDESDQYVLNKSTSTWTAKTWSGLTDFRGLRIWSDGDNIYFSDDSDQYILDKSTSTWNPKTWSGFTNLDGNNIWSDGDNVYYSYYSDQYILDKSTSTWNPKTWSGFTNLGGEYVWTDGDNIYYSIDSSQYVLNKSNSTWSPKTWSGLESISGDSIWSDGDNIYYSYMDPFAPPEHYVLEKVRGFGTAAAKDFTTSVTSESKDLITSGAVYDAIGNLGTASTKDYTTSITSGSTDLPEAGAIYNMLPAQLPTTWSNKTWSGLTNFRGRNVWTDGDNIYYSSGLDQYVLDKSTSTWEPKTWSGVTDFYGSSVWTDGDNIYYSNMSSQYVLDKSTSTWEYKHWEGIGDIDASYVWTDGNNTYFSIGVGQFVLDKSTSTWNTKTWSGLTDFDGYLIWTDGNNIYYSSGSTAGQYVLDKSTSTWNTKTWSGSYPYISGSYIWTDGDYTYYSDGPEQYVLDKATSTWFVKDWGGAIRYDDVSNSSIWTDGVNTYLSDSSHQCVLNKSRGFGSAATKNYTTSVTGGNEDLITSGAVYNAVGNLGTASTKNYTTSVTSGSADLVTAGGVYTYVDTVITQALNGSY